MSLHSTIMPLSSGDDSPEQVVGIANNNQKQFVVFARILLKYLERNDPQMHLRAKEIIRECAAEVKKNKKMRDMLKQQGYHIVAASSNMMIMRTRLRATVGEQHWRRVKQYLIRRDNHYFQNNQRVKRRITYEIIDSPSYQMQNRRSAFVQLKNNNANTNKIETITTLRPRITPKETLRNVTSSFENLLLVSSEEDDGAQQFLY